MLPTLLPGQTSIRFIHSAVIVLRTVALALGVYLPPAALRHTNSAHAVGTSCSRNREVILRGATGNRRKNSQHSKGNSEGLSEHCVGWRFFYHCFTNSP